MWKMQNVLENIVFKKLVIHTKIYFCTTLSILQLAERKYMYMDESSESTSFYHSVERRQTGAKKRGRGVQGGQR